jgi:hypothetical protein
VFIDIVASTSLERAPLLHNYHSRILADSAPEQIAGPLDLSAFVGCDNWVLLAVGEISALDAWKKKMIRAGDLLRPKLEEKANGISRTLAEGLCRPPTTSASTDGIRDGDITRRLQPYYHDSLQYTVKSTLGVPTQLWAYAARIYLSVVVSGWPLSDAQIRSDVAQFLTLLHSVDSIAQMHTLAWPICVAGCLAEGETEQQEFERIIEEACHSQLLSAVREAGRIMKAVWMGNEGLGKDTWDIAACLQILGLPVLLV